MILEAIGITLIIIGLLMLFTTSFLARQNKNFPKIKILSTETRSSFCTNITIKFCSIFHLDKTYPHFHKVFHSQYAQNQ